MAGVPVRIGRYTVAGELGSGGMGEVLLAYSPAGDPVAVKLIRDDRLDPVTRARFEKEALIARTVVGTNRVARFLDADPYADRPWMAMEYVPGRTLLACVDEDGPLPEPLVASLGALLAEGLAVVHSAGLLHRDLKPQNVILGEYGPVVIDFGLAAFLDAGQGTLSHSGMIVGTVRCMPPEQASGHPQVTAAADVYALGTVLLYAATGHYPYEGTRWEAIAAQVTNPEHAPQLGGLPQRLVPLITSMLAYEAADRPGLEEVAQACTGLLTELGLTPAAARRELIDWTARQSGGDPAGDPRAPWTPVLPPAVEERLREQASALGELGLASPLDGPPNVTEPAGDEPESAPEQARVQEGPSGPGQVRQPGGRVPAALRIADELRQVYALQAAL